MLALREAGMGAGEPLAAPACSLGAAVWQGPPRPKPQPRSGHSGTSFLVTGGRAQWSGANLEMQPGKVPQLCPPR